MIHHTARRRVIGWPLALVALALGRASDRLDEWAHRPVPAARIVPRPPAARTPGVDLVEARGIEWPREPWLVVDPAELMRQMDTDFRWRTSDDG